MTETQFTALACVANIGPDTRRHKALKLVMCSGWTASRAAAKYEIGAQTVSNARRLMVLTHSGLTNRLQLITDALGDGTPLEMGAGGKPTHKVAL
jgi:hypothetical protein